MISAKSDVQSCLAIVLNERYPSIYINATYYGLTQNWIRYVGEAYYTFLADIGDITRLVLAAIINHPDEGLIN
jgi:hypothetical protein